LNSVPGEVINNQYKVTGTAVRFFRSVSIKQP